MCSTMCFYIFVHIFMMEEFYNNHTWLLCSCVCSLWFHLVECSDLRVCIERNMMVFMTFSSVVFFVVSWNLVIPCSIRKSNERANGGFLSRSSTCLPNLWMALNTEMLCMLFRFDRYVLSCCLCSKRTVDIWRLFGVFGREVVCLWMEALSYCFYSSPTDTG